MLTDSSLYTPDGKIVGFECKAYPVASWTGAITGRGNTWGMVTALALAEAHGSFDEFVARSAPLIEREHKVALEVGTLQGQSIIEVHVAGWSEQRDRAEAYVLTSPTPFTEEDRPTYVWRSLYGEEEGTFYHALSALQGWQLHRQGAEPNVDFTAETFDPLRHGVPLMEAQRRKGANAALGDHGGRHVIGGDLWLTVVDRDGVRQDIIHSWLDEIGEPIQPAPLDESKLARIPPAGVLWSFERFDAAFRGGAVDPENLALDRAKLALIESAAPAGGAFNRKQRLAAKAQAKKGARAHA